MKCPHCLVEFHDNPKFNYVCEDVEGQWVIKTLLCSACNKSVLFLVNGKRVINFPGGGIAGIDDEKSQEMMRPKTISRAPIPKEVPPEIAEDYKEACLVLVDSTKASAALSRRCLQNLLRSAAHVKPSDLSKEIQEVIDSGKLPTLLAESIDAVRNIGNFSAHPIKSKSTGEIISVEDHEAEWNIDVLESLFDFYYVQPAVLAKKRDLLNKKLAAAGKPLLK